MRKEFIFIVSVVLVLLTACGKKKEIMAPVAKKIPKELTIHGHGGASGRFQWIKDTALEYAFIFNQLGIKQ